MSSLKIKLTLIYYCSAVKAGKFESEIAPIEIKTRKGVKVFQHDEHARPDVTLEQLGKLPTVFKKNGTVTAGSSSVSQHGFFCLLFTYSSF